MIDRIAVARRLASIVTVSVLLASAPLAQEIDIPLLVSNGDGEERELRFGLDPTATDGIDPHLGEAELPPFPPSPVFEARFTGASIGIPEMGLGTYRDYRQGSADFQGEVVHELHYQPGEGSVVVITWDLADGIAGRLQDFITGAIIDEQMIGKGSFTVTNPTAINRLKMTITYGATVGSEGAGETSGFRIRSVSPNPSHRPPHAFVTVPRDGVATVRVLDVLGREVASRNEALTAGDHAISLNREAQSAGLYFFAIEYRSSGETEVARGRFTVVR